MTLEPSASLAAAAGLLAQKRIGSVLILGADRHIVGILSERDIVRVIAERGADVLGEPVSVAMTRKVSTCNESELVLNVMERMSAGKFRHMPVIDQDRAVGMILIGTVYKLWNGTQRRCTTTS